LWWWKTSRKDRYEWPHEKQGEQSSLRREFPLSDKNIKVFNDGVFDEGEMNIS
jgi:hypothetical protein